MIGNRKCRRNESVDIVASLTLISSRNFVELPGVSICVTVGTLTELRYVKTEFAAYVSLFRVVLMTLCALEIGMFPEKWELRFRVVEVSGWDFHKAIGSVALGTGLLERSFVWVGMT